MAASEWKEWTWGYFIIICAFVLLIRSFKRFLQKVHKILYSWVYHFVCVRRDKQLQNRKEALFKDLQTTSDQLTRALCILEVGAGAGANFKYFPKGTNVMCLDPNPYFEKYLRKNCVGYPDVNLQEFLVGRAEDLSILPNGCVDAVISTWVLCSVSEIDLALAEIKRVLRPGGKFFYVEHVCAEKKTWTYLLQRLLNPISSALSSNCHLTRDIAKYITDAGFSYVDHEYFSNDARLFFPKRPHLIGKATKQS